MYVYIYTHIRIYIYIYILCMYIYIYRERYVIGGARGAPRGPGAVARDVRRAGARLPEPARGDYYTVIYKLLFYFYYCFYMYYFYMYYFYMYYLYKMFLHVLLLLLLLYKLVHIIQTTCIIQTSISRLLILHTITITIYNNDNNIDNVSVDYSYMLFMHTVHLLSVYVCLSVACYDTYSSSNNDNNNNNINNNDKRWPMAPRGPCMRGITIVIIMIIIITSTIITDYYYYDDDCCY